MQSKRLFGKSGCLMCLSCPNPHLSPMFLAVVNKRDSLTLLQDAIDRDTCRTFLMARLHGDMVDSFPVPVVDFERIPTLGQARREMQLVYFEPQIPEVIPE